MAGNLIIDKFYANLIKSYIKKNILVYDKEKALSSRDFHISKSNLDKNDYDNFLRYLKEINTICKINNESNFMTDLIVYLVKTLCDGVFQTNNNISNCNEPRNININQAILNHQINSHFNSVLSKIYLSIFNFLASPRDFYPINAMIPNTGSNVSLSSTQFSFKGMHPNSLNSNNSNQAKLDNKKLFYKHIDKVIRFYKNNLMLDVKSNLIIYFRF